MTDRWQAAQDLIHVTDHARELGKVGRLTEVDRDLVAMAERAWDAVRIEGNPSGDRS